MLVGFRVDEIGFVELEVGLLDDEEVVAGFEVVEDCVVDDLEVLEEGLVDVATIQIL